VRSSIGEKFGLYGALAESGPATADEVARSTGVPAHHVSDWLDAQARADYLDYDKASGRFSVYCSLPSAA
jgi:DNA-binding IclR family transcriptional regulator